MVLLSLWLHKDKDKKDTDHMDCWYVIYNSLELH